MYSMQNIDEPALIAQSLGGDTGAYGQLVDCYKNAVYRHSFAIVRDEDVAEDIAQDTFIAAFYALKRFNPNKGRLSTWLFKIATNKALNWLKKTAREVFADDKTIARIAANNPEPSVVMLRTELHSAVERLQPKYRAVVSLYYWQGLSYTEIANIMSAPEGSVKVWMLRAKQVLRKELA